MSWERKMFLDTIARNRIIVDFITEKKLFLLPIDSFRWFLWTISNDKRQSVEESLISGRLASRSFKVVKQTFD
jgi:hypothetical protein